MKLTALISSNFMGSDRTCIAGDAHRGHPLPTRTATATAAGVTDEGAQPPPSVTTSVDDSRQCVMSDAREAHTYQKKKPCLILWNAERERERETETPTCECPCDIDFSQAIP